MEFYVGEIITFRSDAPMIDSVTKEAIVIKAGTKGVMTANDSIRLFDGREVLIDESVVIRGFSESCMAEYILENLEKDGFASKDIDASKRWEMLKCIARSLASLGMADDADKMKKRFE